MRGEDERFPEDPNRTLTPLLDGYAEGRRTKKAEMTNVMKALSPAEREAMARYISGL